MNQYGSLSISTDMVVKMGKNKNCIRPLIIVNVLNALDGETLFNTQHALVLTWFLDDIEEEILKDMLCASDLERSYFKWKSYGRTHLLTQNI